MDAKLHAIQLRLVDLGYDPGPLDGVWGPQTRDAIAKAIAAPKPRPAATTQPQAPWMDLALNEIGVAEAPGAANNPRILEYFKAAGGGWAKHDSVPWCAAYVGWALEQAGYRCSRSLGARSYLEWGAGLTAPRAGAVVVLKRGAPPAGHVGFALDWTSTQITLLGGNQSNAVSKMTFKRSDVLGMRWPTAA